MEVTTKFAIGDVVWCLLHSRATSFKIAHIQISRSSIQYISERYDTYAEAEVFKTKEELMAYAFGESNDE